MQDGGWCQIRERVRHLKLRIFFFHLINKFKYN